MHIPLQEVFGSYLVLFKVDQSLHFWWAPNRYQIVLRFCSLPRYNCFPPLVSKWLQGFVRVPLRLRAGPTHPPTTTPARCVAGHCLPRFLPPCAHAHTSNILISLPPPQSQHWLVESIWTYKNCLFWLTRPRADFFHLCAGPWDMLPRHPRKGGLAGPGWECCEPLATTSAAELPRPSSCISPGWPVSNGC